MTKPIVRLNNCTLPESQTEPNIDDLGISAPPTPGEMKQLSQTQLQTVE